MLSNEKFQEFLGFLDRAKKSETILSRRLATLANQHEINTSEWQALLDHVSEIQAYLSALMSYRRPSLQMDPYTLHHLFGIELQSTERCPTPPPPEIPSTPLRSSVMSGAAPLQSASDTIPNPQHDREGPLMLTSLSDMPSAPLPQHSQSLPPQHNLMMENTPQFGAGQVYPQEEESEFYQQYSQPIAQTDLEYADDTIDETYRYGRPDYEEPPANPTATYREDSWTETTADYDRVEVIHDDYGESGPEPVYEYRESPYRGQNYESYASVSASHRRSPRKNGVDSQQRDHLAHKQKRTRKRDGVPQWLFFGRVNPKCTVKDFLGALHRHGFRVINTIRVHKGDKWNYVPKVKLETSHQMTEALRMRITIFNTSVNVKPYIENDDIGSNSSPFSSRHGRSSRASQRKKRGRLVKRNPSRKSSPIAKAGMATTSPNRFMEGRQLGRQVTGDLDRAAGEVSPSCESDGHSESPGLESRILGLNINHSNTPSGMDDGRLSAKYKGSENVLDAGEVG